MTYDASGRRIMKTIDQTGILDATPYLNPATPAVRNSAGLTAFAMNNYKYGGIDPLTEEVAIVWRPEKGALDNRVPRSLRSEMNSLLDLTNEKCNCGKLTSKGLFPPNVFGGI